LLDSAKSIPEQNISEDTTLLFKRKFVMDMVSADDPITLHLVYIEVL
jgi:hypothetical protein